MQSVFSRRGASTCKSASAGKGGYIYRPRHRAYAVFSIQAAQPISFVRTRKKFFLYTHCIFILIYRCHGEIVIAPSTADQLMGANQQ
ncbi:hypothetical protein F3P66_22965 [Agrobacterium fabrum]|uniref:Uncharacterized protein n=1 Tax=Agrobacterium fabrum (strain C58 / ATCC 33970) TaxID=176299 RepID=Q8U6X9_AGRFC|nr:hypothetical protein Atu4677 [Agrobacterium fabrum str. C58]QKW98741.1 hypothetical protein GSF67_16215 [Agrobacterium sp. CGMCC 11546]QRM62193.1 hypothetical protein F3P66_22965 [Agrobacterium fabrum]TRB26556.1 hypothetical protein EXN51_22095 [Agrobacterium fabrum]